jgi:nitric oxide synthase-interacting protein
MYPAYDAVVSPSGHVYSRESILEYLLAKSKELKRTQQLYEEQQRKLEADRREEEMKQVELSHRNFMAATDAIERVKRSIDEVDPSSNEYFQSRKKLIDDSNKEKNIEDLKRVSPWVPQFTPAAKESIIAEPPKRPSSPFSGRPLRAKDLIPINLLKETSDSSDKVRFICPVSRYDLIQNISRIIILHGLFTRKTITNQKVIIIKSTGSYMLEQTARELAYPSMVCPLSGKRFDMSDILELVQATSAFSATGQVEAKVHRPTIN